MSQVSAVWTPPELLNAEQYNLGGIAPQVGDDAASRSTKRDSKSAMMPQRDRFGLILLYKQQDPTV
jgi:hypothetical protein